MSNKPLKHSEIKKKMEKKKRKEGAILVKPEKIYLFCEGIKTEPNYFFGIKKKIKDKYGERMKNKIQIDIRGTGRSTESLLDYAKKEIEAKKKSGETYNHVWLIYDKDDFDDFDDMENKVKCLSNKDETEWHVAWSNQAIEIWFLLHFHYYNTNIHRNEYIDKLSENFNKFNLGKYEKNMDNIYETLCTYGNLDFAIKNAERLYSSYDEDEVLSNKAPATRVHELVEVLRPHT